MNTDIMHNVIKLCELPYFVITLHCLLVALIYYKMAKNIQLTFNLYE